MPRNVRNFWIEAEIPGRKTALVGGPVSRTGGIYVKVLQRKSGIVARAATIQGHANNDGTLTLTILDGAGSTVHTYTTPR
jgi:hypothetical protein